MGRFARHGLLLAAFGLSMVSDSARANEIETMAIRSPRSGPEPARDLGTLNTQVRLLMEHSDPLAAEIVAGWVMRGLPPSVLVTFLEASRRRPRASLAPALRYLMTYRRAAIRGRAMAAMVALGGMEAHRALLAGLDDMDPRVRRLAYELAKVHGDPAVEEAVFRLIDRDPALAEDWHRTHAPPPPPPPDVMIIEDDE